MKSEAWSYGPMHSRKPDSRTAPKAAPVAGRRHVASIEVVFQAYAHYLKGTSRSETECAAELHAWIDDIQRGAFITGWTAARTQPNIAAASHSPTFPSGDEPYTPTTDDIRQIVVNEDMARHLYLDGGDDETAADRTPIVIDAFERWLSRHDAEVKAETLARLGREGGIRYKEDAGDESAIRPTTLAHIEYLHTWADHIFDYFTRRKAGPWTPEHTSGGE